MLMAYSALFTVRASKGPKQTLKLLRIANRLILALEGGRKGNKEKKKVFFKGAVSVAFFPKEP